MKKAVVTGADEKGVQVTVQGIAATIKKADLSKENNDPLSYHEGDILEAKLTSVDRKNTKLGVSVKAYELEEQKKKEENKTSEQLLQEIIVLLKQSNSNMTNSKENNGGDV